MKTQSAHLYIYHILVQWLLVCRRTAQLNYTVMFLNQLNCRYRVDNHHLAFGERSHLGNVHISDHRCFSYSLRNVQNQAVRHRHNYLLNCCNHTLTRKNSEYTTLKVIQRKDYYQERTKNNFWHYRHIRNLNLVTKLINWWQGAWDFNLPQCPTSHTAIWGLLLLNGSTESPKNLEQRFIFQIGTLNPHGIKKRFSSN